MTELEIEMSTSISAAPSFPLLYDPPLNFSYLIFPYAYALNPCILHQHKMVVLYIKDHGGLHSH